MPYPKCRSTHGNVVCRIGAPPIRRNVVSKHDTNVERVWSQTGSTTRTATTTATRRTTAYPTRQSSGPRPNQTAATAPARESTDETTPMPGPPRLLGLGNRPTRRALVTAIAHTEQPLIRPPARNARALAGESDAIDTEAAARSVLGQQTYRVAQPRGTGTRAVLRVLLASRSLLDQQRTASRNALTALLRTIDLGIDATNP